jgi:threonyl-tRNA synthetase
VQAVVVPVAERHQSYAREVASALERQGLRVHVDDRNEKMGYKIREAQVQQVPYMLVVGDVEVEAKNVSVRHRRAGDLGPQPVEAFGARVARLARERVVEEEAAPPTEGGVS